MSRRAHIKRAKILRGRWMAVPAIVPVHLMPSRKWIARCERIHQALRGYYQD